MINTVIVGAGTGGTKLLQALIGQPQINVLCIVDIRSDAPGVTYARANGITVLEDYHDAIPLFRETAVDVILEATGNDEVFRDLTLVAPNIPVISGVDLKFFMILIEDKVQLIHELEFRQRDLQLVLNATHDAMVGIHRDGRISLYNAAAERLLGVSVNQAYGQPVQNVIPNSRLLHVIETGEEEINQVQCVGDIEIVTNRVPVYDESHNIIGAIAIFRDVTELRQLAAEATNLREIQTMLEAVIQSTQDAISVVDQNGNGLLINPAYTRLTGLRPAQVLNKPADVDIAEGESMHMQVLRTQKAVRNVPLKVGPARREVLVDVAPIIVNGQLRGSVGVIHDVSEIKRLTEELDKANKLLRTMQAKYTFDDIAGKSPAMVMAIDQARKAASTPATVLLRGESGTGKELFAHALHNESDRQYMPFVRVNCAALADSLLESELFGYEEGAFTGAKRGGKRGLFEEASGGTLFLDEIGEMSVATQAKLLRALQEQEIIRVGGTKPVRINVRMIVATHVNLEQAVAAGRFREDLYYRLNVIPIVIPPLRYRLEDMESIILHIIARHNQMYGRNVADISNSAVELLKNYEWPGNVRELENTIGRAMIHMGYHETVLEAHHLPILQRTMVRALPDVEEQVRVASRGTLQQIVEEVEQAVIHRVLKDVDGNKTEAARRLGISVRTLYNKIGH